MSSATRAIRASAVKARDFSRNLQPVHTLDLKEARALPVPRRRSFTLATSRAHRIWPVAGLGFVVIVDVAWMGFLGFGFFKLIEAEFL